MKLKMRDSSKLIKAVIIHSHKNDIKEAIENLSDNHFDKLKQAMSEVLKIKLITIKKIEG